MESRTNNYSRKKTYENKVMFPTITTNKENVSGPLPQPKVKIVDLQHNLLYDG